MKKLFFLLIFYLSLPNQIFALTVPFTVTERLGVPRIQSHINYSIPIAKADNLLTTRNMAITGHDAEFTVLSRYGGAPTDSLKPIRMVLIDFQDNIDANATNYYTFTTNGSGNVSYPNIATDYTDYVEINTGTAIFRISKHIGNLFEHVSVNGKTLIDSPTTSGMTVTVNGIDYTSYYNTPSVEIYRNGPMTAVIIVRGNLESLKHNLLVPPTPELDSVVPDSHVEYAFYYWFYKGKSFVKVDQTLKNNGRGWSRYPYASVEHLFINEWRTEIEYTEAAADKTVDYEDYSDTFSEASYSLFQWENNHSGFDSKTYDFTYDLKKNGNPVTSGIKYSGYAGVRDDYGGVMVTDKYFWQNYPGEYKITNNVLTYSFLPERKTNFTGLAAPAGYSMLGNTARYLDNSPQYRILGGMWKTQKTGYYFHTTNSGYKEFKAEIQKPLIIQCTPAYVGHTQFFSFQFDPNFSVSYTFPAGESLQGAINFWSSQAQAIWDSSKITERPAYAQSIFDARAKRDIALWKWSKDSDSTTHNTYGSWYGWLRFGNSPRAWAYGYNSQHYDFTYQAILVWLRYGYYPAFEMYEEMVEHLTDVLTFHDPGSIGANNTYNDNLLHGSQRYELDSLNDNYKDRSFPINDPFVGNAHVWTRGIFIQYLYTGDPRYAEVMEQNVYHCNALKDIIDGSGETRDETRLLGVLINDWEVNGKPSDLDTAWDIWSVLEAAGHSPASDQFYLDCRIVNTVGCPNSSDQFWIGYDAMGTSYLLRLYYALREAGMATRAASLKDKIEKIAIWNKEKVMGAWNPPAGTYNGTTYHPYTTTNALCPNSDDKDSSNAYTWDESHFNSNYSLAWCDLYAFMYREGHGEEWLTMARTAFKDRFMYGLCPGSAVHVSTTYPNIPGLTTVLQSGSWKFGMYLTKPQLYLQTEQWLSGGWTALENNTPIIREIIIR